MTIKIKTVWITKKDGEVCAKCKALEGYTWTFDAGDPYPKKLVHPLYGPVFDLRPAADESLIEEKKGHRCRCKLQHQFEICEEATDDNGKIEQEHPAAEPQ
jgi:hypothetical protein